MRRRKIREGVGCRGGKEGRWEGEGHEEGVKSGGGGREALMKMEV